MRPLCHPSGLGLSQGQVQFNIVLHLGGIHGGLGDRQPAGSHLQPGLGRSQGSLSLVLLGFEQCAIQAEQDIARLDGLPLLDEYLNHPAGHLRRDDYLDRLDGTRALQAGILDGAGLLPDEPAATPDHDEDEDEYRDQCAFSVHCYLLIEPFAEA